MRCFFRLSLSHLKKVGRDLQANGAERSLMRASLQATQPSLDINRDQLDVQ